MTPAKHSDYIELNFDGINIRVSGRKLRRMRKIFISLVITTLSYVSGSIYKFIDIQVQLNICKQQQQIQQKQSKEISRK